MVTSATDVARRVVTSEAPIPKSQLRIYMPVDGPFWHQEEMLATEKADCIISVTPEILARYKPLGKPMMQINHGVAREFLDQHNGHKSNGLTKVGYSGSLVRSDLDFDVFLKVISSHPNLQFEFWGEKDFRKSSIHLPQDVTERTKNFLETLSGLPNVKMHGPVSPAELARGIGQMDALLICYSIKNDQNHHKVLEYLGTGKVIVSNYLSSYERDYPGLIEMVSSKDHNNDLPELFERVMTSLSIYNSDEKQEARRNFAKSHSYSNNILRIQEFVNSRVFGNKVPNI